VFSCTSNYVRTAKRGTKSGIVKASCTAVVEVWRWLLNLKPSEEDQMNIVPNVSLSEGESGTRNGEEKRKQL
jgi:hypothetical protein